METAALIVNPLFFSTFYFDGDGLDVSFSPRNSLISHQRLLY